MDFDQRKRKNWPDDGGVSEVIGNIMILMITVVLFSGIIAFVQQMPVPEQTVRADFSASISFSGNYEEANLTIIHAGGKVLDAQDIRILVEKDGTNYGYNLSDDPSFTSPTWSTGKAWKMQLDDMTATSVIIVTIADLKNSQMIWTSQVTGGAGLNPPSILQRYTDAYPTTPTPDAVKENQTFRFFVKVVDADDDLAAGGVWINSLGVDIPKSQNSHWVGTYKGDGWYYWDFDVVWNAEKVDGGVIVIHAFDNANHEAISSFIVSVTILPSEPRIEKITSYPPVGEWGLPSYLAYLSVLGHGFGFYGEKIVNGTPNGEADTSAAVTSFYKDSNVFIRFASLSMSNLLAQNTVTIKDTRTGVQYSPYYPPNMNSTSSTPFVAYPAGGGAYIFECVFNTTNLPPSAYTVSLYLRNQPGIGQTQQTFTADQMITVNQEGSSSIFVPEVKAYRDSAHTQEWGNSTTKPFDLSDASNATIYVTVGVQSTDSNPNCAQVRINDMSGGAPLYGVPPSGMMISSIGNMGDGKRYNFSISLRLNNGDQWLPGLNAYTLYISRLNDTNEGVYSLSKQVWIKGSLGKADFFVGTAGFSPGNKNFNTRLYQYYIQNNNFFTSRVMWQSESTPSSSVDYTVTAVGIGDIDDDGDKDLLMGQANSNALYLFENTLSQFGTWQSGSLISRPDSYTYPITWITFGDLSGDGHPDFAYSNHNSQIVLYNTTYGSKGWVFNPSIDRWTGTISKIALEDITGDGRADLIVLAGGRLWMYDLKYAYDNSLKDYQSGHLMFKKSDGTGIKDFDIADVDRNARLDVVTAGTSSAFGGSTPGVSVCLFQPTNSTVAKLNPTFDDDGLLRFGTNGTTTGSVVNTLSDTDGLTLTLAENELQGDGSVEFVMQFTKLASVADQTLRIKSYVSPGASETFYVFVSPDNVSYNYVGEISRTSMGWDTFRLPSNVIDSYMYIKIKDSLTSLGTTDSLVIDYIDVITETIGFGDAHVGSTAYTTVRAANIDGLSGYMEVVMAKSGSDSDAIVIEKYNGGWSGLLNPPTGNATFYVNAGSKVNDATKYPFSSLASTIFDAVDVNGDGYTDILTTNYSQSGTGGDVVTTSRIGFWMNLYTTSASWRYYEVKTWDVSGKGTSLPDPYLTVAMAESLAED